jgi:hypothetical protein
VGHFIFRYLGHDCNEHLRSVSINKYFPPAKDWQPKAGSQVRVVMRLCNDAPLLVEQPFGKGRVMAFLSTAAPGWNHWADSNETGSFPLVIRELFAYLARRPGAAVATHQVGDQLRLNLDASKYQAQIRFVKPSGEAAASTVEQVPTAEGRFTATLPQTDSSGFYEALLTKTNGKPEVRTFAVNVDAAEGDLRAFFGPELAERLSPQLKYQFDPALTFESNLSETSGRNLSEFLLYMLILLLIGEQILAWSCSYHLMSRAAERGPWSGRGTPAAPRRVPAFASSPQAMAEGGVR